MHRACVGAFLVAVLLAGWAQTSRAEELAASPTFTPEEVRRLKEIAASDKRLVRSSVDIALYGYVKFDLAYDAHATDEGDFARWVASEGAAGEDDQLSATVRETRVGLELDGPRACGAEATGKIELDFFGGGASNSNVPRLRHAYVRLHWPAARFAILAGQTWDVHAPQNMPTINYSVGWWVGNLGFRRPQLRVTKDFPLSPSRHVRVELAAARTITGRSSPFTPPFEDTGEDEAFPTVQGRLSLGGESRWGAHSVLGLSGHWGREELDRAGGTESHFDTWSVALDFSLAMAPCLTLKGEAWTGRNLDAYLAGVGQGLDTTVAGAEREIDAYGGWLAASYELGPRWTLAAGAGIDDPENADLAAGMRTQNLTAFLNAWFRVLERVRVGAEVSYWLTHYLGLPRGESVRVQLAFRYDV